MTHLSREQNPTGSSESRTRSQLECDDSGVPKRGVLVGLLHIININDFPECHDDGEAIVYVDDDSHFVNAKYLATLKNKIQVEADNSAQWLKDNRKCVAGDKSKLLVLATTEIRAAKIVDEEMMITVDGKEVALLGAVLNNQLTWKNRRTGGISASLSMSRTTITSRCCKIG